MIVRLSDVVNKISGDEDRFTTDLNYYLGGDHYESNRIAIYKKGDLHDDINILGFKFHFRFKSGDTIFMSRNPHLRKCGMVTYDGICSDTSYILRTKDESVLLGSFLPLILQNDRFWRWFEENKSGSVNYLLNWKTLKEYEFELPSIEEQKRMSDLAWAIEETRVSYENMISATDELVKSQFIEMFGDINSLGLFPRKKWKDVVTIINGKDYKKVQIESGGYPVYGTGGEMARASDYLTPENSVIIGRKGTIDKPLLVREKFWNVDTAFGVVSNANELHYMYLFWYCKQIDFSKLNKATTLPSTTKVDLLNLWINVPPMAKQIEFASFVEQSDKSKFSVVDTSNLNLSRCLEVWRRSFI